MMDPTDKGESTLKEEKKEKKEKEKEKTVLPGLKAKDVRKIAMAKAKKDVEKLIPISRGEFQIKQTVVCFQ